MRSSFRKEIRPLRGEKVSHGTIRGESILARGLENVIAWNCEGIFRTERPVELKHDEEGGER